MLSLLSICRKKLITSVGSFMSNFNSNNQIAPKKIETAMRLFKDLKLTITETNIKSPSSLFATIKNKKHNIHNHFSQRLIHVQAYNNKNNLSTLFKLNKHYFSEFQINRKALNKKKIQVEKQTESLKTRIYLEKKLNKLLAIAIVSFLIFWGLNGKELFSRLEVDKKYLKKIKEKEEENNIDLEYNETLINQFDEKYGINKPIDDFMNKLQYGNKEFNTIEEENTQDPNKNGVNSGQNENEKLIIDLTNPLKQEGGKGQKAIEFDFSKERGVTVEEKEIQLGNEQKRNVRKIKGDGYEQISIYEKNFDNPDPRILGSTIVFDSRLDDKK